MEYIHYVVNLSTVSKRAPGLLRVEQKLREIARTAVRFAGPSWHSLGAARSGHYLLENLQRMLPGKRFESDDVVIVKTKAYFKDLDK